MDYIKSFFDSVLRLSPGSVTFSDILEIIIFSYLIYHIILWIKRSKAWILLKGAAAIFIIYILAAILHLNNSLYVFNHIGPYVVTGLLIVFQPEIRRALEQLGTNKLFRMFSIGTGHDKNNGLSKESIEAIVRASYSLGRAKTGALIVIEKNIVLNDYIATGIILNAVISAPLLVQIFEHNTPLHDGALIIRGNQIAAATCYLPLSENKTISKELGTRHRAGLGISEVTDSVTVIVSEETGYVSLAVQGTLYRNISSDYLRERLNMMQNKNNESALLKLWKGKQKNAEKD